LTKMKTSDRGICSLIQHEGIVPAPYLDSVGVLTYGVGHTKAAGKPDPATLPKGMPDNLDAALEDVFALLNVDLEKYESDVNKAITEPISQHEFDAAVSFHYNTGAIASATWVKTLNGGDHALAATQIMNWVKPAEIIPRRQAEQDLFSKGTYPSGSAIVWKVDSNYKVIWTPETTLTPDQVLGYFEPKDEKVKLKDKIKDKIPTVCPTCDGRGLI